MADSEIKIPIYGPDGGPLPDGDIERTPGINAREDDPRWVDPESPTTNNDFELRRSGPAENQAKILDEGYTSAASNRAAASAIEAYKNDVEELPPRGKGYFSDERKAHRKAKREALNRYLDAIDPFWGSDDVHHLDLLGALGADPEDMQVYANAIRQKAAAHERVSDRELKEQLTQEGREKLEALREITQALIDHPIHESYAAEHPDIDFSPSGLLAASAEALVLLDRATGYFDQSSAMGRNLRKLKALNLDEEIQHLSAGNPEAINKAQALIQRGSSERLGSDKAQLFVALMMVEGLRLRARADAIREVFEDIYSGRASQSPDPQTQVA